MVPSAIYLLRFLIHFCSPYKEPPLFNMEFVILGNNLTRSRNEIERTVKKLGGKIAATIHYKLAAVISNEEELHKMSEQILTAKLYGIQIVSEAFLTEVAELNIDPILYIISQSISDWGGDVSVFCSQLSVFVSIFIAKTFDFPVNFSHSVV